PIVTPTTDPAIHPLSLHDALPISASREAVSAPRPDCFLPAKSGSHRPQAGRCRRDANPARATPAGASDPAQAAPAQVAEPGDREDRKSTRLNSSHLGSSYAVFCLK